jgi:disulfide bond formation protein DsbB
MPIILRYLDFATPRRLATLVLFVAMMTIGGALYIEHVMGLRPCPLCLEQRTPWYIAIAVAAILASMKLSPRWQTAGFVVLAIILAWSVGLGVHHAGVEWRWWQGPAGCSGGTTAGPAGLGDFLKELGGTRVVSCTEAALRIFRLSLAGWNALLSMGLLTIAAWGAQRAYGSRTLSQ